MNRKHAFAISLLLGLAIVAGAFAATRGGGEADAQATVTPIAGNALAAENARLDRYEATLDRLLAQARRRAARASAARSERRRGRGARPGAVLERRTTTSATSEPRRRRLRPRLRRRRGVRGR